MSKYNVIVGDDFQIEAFELQDIEDISKLSKIANGRAQQRIQERLTYLILISIVAALLSATAIGLFDGSFDEVGLVWSAAALPLGYILKAFFDEPKPP
ncbi:hypothetical protein [Parasphingorhabdus sp.]|uniref:hypothetical protein n=1 Tax=Parasphingorhabdus sp. TaxID=2709688 RepID=UPI0030018746